MINYYILIIEKPHGSFLVLAADKFLYGWFTLACFLLSFEVLRFDATPVYSEVSIEISEEIQIYQLRNL